MTALVHLRISWRCIGELWKYSTWQKNGVDAFGYNSAEIEPILMKSGALWAHCWGLALADFGRDLHSSDSLRGSRNFVFFCQVNNARFHPFPVWQILWHLTTTTSIGEAVKTFGTEFWKFYRRGRFSVPKVYMATPIDVVMRKCRKIWPTGNR